MSGVLLVALVCAVAPLGGCSKGSGVAPSSSDGAASVSTTTSTSTSTGTAAPPDSRTPQGQSWPANSPALAGKVPPVAATTLAPVAVGQTAPLQGKVTVGVVAVTDVKIAASGPGEVAGSGVAVRIRIRNGTPAPIDLGALTVNVYLASSAPAPPSDAKPAHPLAGRLAPGESAQGTYVFQTPKADGQSLQVEISSGQFPNVVIVRR